MIQQYYYEKKLDVGHLRWSLERVIGQQVNRLDIQKIVDWRKRRLDLIFSLLHFWLRLVFIID